MRPLLTDDGERALAAILPLRPLLAFDFDGTLAPIVAHPAQARVAPAVAALLTRLAARLPLAIVTGRSVADVRGRLGFMPHYIVGNHGAEDDSDHAGVEARSGALAPLRARLFARGAELADAEVLVEDKGPSIALHYRLSRQRERALALIGELLDDTEVPLHVFPGKMVVNAMAAGAPDKADAVNSLLRRSHTTRAVFVGDDVNDEPVFASAPADWLTVRIGRDDPSSRAQYVLEDQAALALVLERMLRLLDDRGR